MLIIRHAWLFGTDKNISLSRSLVWYHLDQPLNVIYWPSWQKISVRTSQQWKYLVCCSWARAGQNQQNDLCAPVKIDLCALWVGKEPNLQADSEDWSEWGDAQADLSLCWAHWSFCCFCHTPAQLSMYVTTLEENQLLGWTWNHHKGALSWE